MYYKPNSNYFKPQELMPPEYLDGHIFKGNVQDQVWRVFDWKVLYTCDRLREKYGSMIINDYLWGGNNRYRGYRPAMSLLDKDEFYVDGIPRAKWSSFTSQHCFGRAVDAKFKKYSAEEIRKDILADPYSEEFKYITCIEADVSWLHFDTRCWNKNLNGILVIRP
jgi:hypothetical protein